MEDNDIRFNPIGNGFCLVIMSLTTEDAIEFEGKLKEPKLYISLNGNNMLLLFESKLSQSIEIKTTINKFKVALIQSRSVTHLSIGYRNMNLLTDTQCIPISVEYRLQ